MRFCRNDACHGALEAATLLPHIAFGLMSTAELYPSTFASHAPTARQVALDLIGTVLRRKRSLDDAVEDNPAMAELSARDRAFARLLVATVLRRLGQIDTLI